MDGFDEYYQREILNMPDLSSNTPSVSKRTPKK